MDESNKIGQPESGPSSKEPNKESLMSLMDILERTKNSYSLLLSITSSTTDAVFIKDLNGKYIFANDAVSKIIGKSVEEIIGKDDNELFSKKCADAIIKQDLGVLECEKTKTEETVIHTSSGETKIFLATKGPICDESGNVTGIFGISRDITDRKKSELELKRVVRTLKMITECNKILLHSETEQDLLNSICEIIIKHGGYFMSWIGYVGQNGEKIVRPVARAGFDDGYLDSIEISWDENKENGRGPTGTAVREKRPVYIKNVLTEPTFAPWRENAIKRGYNSTLALPLLIKNNVIGALCLYANEIEVFNKEEVKLLEELSTNISQCIQHIRDKEEKKKTEALLKKSEQQLQIRQRMDSLGTLAGGFAHDFNNLLAGIMGYLELLNYNGPLSEQQKDYVKNAIQGSKRAAELIKQLQSLSKNVISEKTSLDIYDIASEVFSLLDKTTDKIINKIVNFKKGDFYVLGNSSELHQVLLNLGLNSSQAIQEKGAKDGDFIKINVEDYKVVNTDKTGLPEGYYVHISFEDNGVGMSEEILRKAFDPLFTTREKGIQKGQGLGLAMVYNIITKIHKGHIYIDSKEGIGTTMHIYLPKAQKKVEDIFLKESNNHIGKETILVVEDEKSIQDFVKIALEMKGYNVITASDGKEGLEVYTANIDSIDTVILDLTMPKMSGQEVLEKMLEIKNNIKVIISSGQSDETARQGILSKAKGNIHKPYTLVDLYNTVRKVLNGEEK